MSASDKAAIEWELMRLCVDFAHGRLNGRQEILGAMSGVSPAEASKK